MDSGATKHMCCNKDLFSELIEIRGASEIKVGDGRCLQTAGIGKVSLKIKLPGNKLSSFELVNVLFVPELAYNLISVSTLTKAGKITSFYRKSCEIFDHQNELLAVANKRGELYFMNLATDDYANAASTCVNKCDLWHKRFGHVNKQSLQKLVSDNLVDGLDLDSCKEMSFCEPCVFGKNHRAPFPKKSDRKTTRPLELRGSSQNFGIFFIIVPILLKFSHNM